MRFPIAKTVLALLLGITVSAYARAERGQGGHPQEARPAQQQARPAQRQQRQAGPTQQQHVQRAAHSQQQQARPAGRAPQGNSGRSPVRPQQSQPVARSNGGNEHGRISDAHYAAHFGSRHSFHVNRGDYDHRRFEYGGYAFGFIDPWPIGWGYSDDVYVEYTDGGYYMYDRVHPGVRISINII
jgi:hypothetical protein